MEEVQKNLKRTVSITAEMLDDVKEMLKLLGVPIIDAPAEAEAQCAELVKAGLAHAVASEDMDALAFGSRLLLRGFNNKKEPIIEINLETVLDSLDLTYEEFVDLCILLGCDYSKTIVGVGPAKAYTLIKQFSKIETVCEFIRTTNNKKYEIPEDFHYLEARRLLKKPKVLSGESLQINWGEPDEDKVKEFLVGSKGFSLNRVENSLMRLHKKQKFAQQPRIDKFFAVPSKRLKDNPDKDGMKKLKA
jgi:flap endonuclease-1